MIAAYGSSDIATMVSELDMVNVVQLIEVRFNVFMFDNCLGFRGLKCLDCSI